jgi:hypothetical protein
MNCRFCGTVVPPPPSDCPKCGRPVSGGDVSRSNARSAIATIVYREEDRADSTPSGWHGPRRFVVPLVIAAMVVTAVALLLSHPKPKQPDPIAVISSPTPAASPSALPTNPANVVGNLPTSGAAGSADATPRKLVPESGQPEEAAAAPEMAGPDADELVARAGAAFDRGDWLTPGDDNALKWARMAEKAGRPSASRIEDQIYSGMMKKLADLRASHDREAALKLVNEMIRSFPNHNSLSTIRSSIVKEDAVPNQ